MGYTVLYIAFGAVALWLLGEVLLQYKARLRWRLLAFAGFMGVVAGVALPQVVLIVLGAAAFGTGQTFVTLSYRRGFTTGWSLAAGRPGPSRRRKNIPEDATLEVSGVEETEYADAYPDEPVAPANTRVFSAGYGEEADRAQIYSPSPMPDETGEYGIYTDRSSYVSDPYTSGGFEGYGAQGYGTDWQEEPQPATAYAYDTFAAGTADDDVFANGASGTGSYSGGYDQQQPYQQEPYQPYSYASYDSAPQPAESPAYDPYGQYQQQDYGYQQQYPQDAYQPDPQSYGYAAPQQGDAWAPADPYAQQLPHIPQQPQPPYDQPDPAETYDPYQQYPTYQPNGY